MGPSDLKLPLGHHFSANGDSKVLQKIISLTSTQNPPKLFLPLAKESLLSQAVIDQSC